MEGHRDKAAKPAGSNVYLRGATYWVRFRIGGEEFRETLRTSDSTEAAKRAEMLVTLRQRRAYGAINPSWRERIYFAHDIEAGRIKVGISRDPGTRIRSIKVNSAGDVRLLGSLRGALTIETLLHTFLAPYHHRGEWFRATPAVLKFVDGLLALDDEMERSGEYERMRRAETKRARDEVMRSAITGEEELYRQAIGRAS